MSDISILKKVSRIYNQLSDDLSKVIYINHFMFNITKDWTFIEEIVKNMPEGKETFNLLSQNMNQEKIIFGAGVFGQGIQNCFPSIKWSYYLDNNISSGTIINGIPVLSFSELLHKHMDSYIVISAFRYEKEMESQLLQHGFPKKNILNLGATTEKLFNKEYFDLDYLIPTENEYFVDAGVFDGRSTLSFYRWAKECYKSAYLFEPDTKCINIIKNNLNGLKYKIIKKALWDKEGLLSFQPNNGASYVSEQKMTEEQLYEIVDATTLDREFGNNKITFIKMDIEGSELRALKGAENIIKEQKPKLAISLYHKPEDIWEIPEIILSYNQDYNLYVRHYSFGHWETVLYAVPKR